MSDAILSATKALRTALEGFDARIYSGDDAARVAEDLALTAKIMDGVRTQSALRASECGAHQDRGYSNASEWVARTTGESAGKARAELELATGLDDNPQLKNAVERGDVSLTEGVEIAKTEAECPGSTPEMLRETKRRGLRGVKEQGRRKRQEAQSPEELAAKQQRARGWRRWVDELGMRCGEYRLPPEIGIRFEKRLDAEIDRQWKAGTDQHRREPRERRAADALATAVLDGRTKPHTVRPECLVVYNTNDHTAHIPDGGPIDTATLRELAKDALFTVVTHDGNTVDSYIRYTKTIPRWLRVLLEAGPPPDFDGFTCLDCGRHYHLEIDHIDPRANGGPTAIFNLGPRCPHCHKAKTETDRQAGLLDGNGHKPVPETTEQSALTGRGPP